MLDIYIVRLQYSSYLPNSPVYKYRQCWTDNLDEAIKIGNQWSQRSQFKGEQIFEVAEYMCTYGITKLLKNGETEEIKVKVVNL